MYPNLQTILFAVLFLLSSQLVGQAALQRDFDFSDQTADLLQNPNFKSNLIIAVADVNNDQLDDIIRFSNGRRLEVQLQNNGSTFTRLLNGESSLKEQFTICIADVDNNGWNDILYGDPENGLRILHLDGELQNPGPVTLEESIFFVQGTNFADINGDGWIDLFACNDTGPSRIWLNDQSGNLIPNATIIDLAPEPITEMNAGNYSSLWIDFDNDHDLDLYISKCFAFASSETDPRRVNQLFVNNGNNEYEEMAESYGLADGLQSWTSDFQDIDNDGDLDCFVVNHYAECKLYENDGQGYYTDITASSGLNITQNHLQLAMRDFDNDGWVDILVAGIDGYEFYNNLGEGTFQKVDDLFEGYLMGTFAIGDLNNDGFPDIYSASAEAIDRDILWINLRDGENSYLSVSLEGRISNPNGIGSRIELYGDWGVQLREVRSGESYGIMHSLIQTFGLGQSAGIDSIIVRWPSGIVDKYEEPGPNRHIHLIEGDCLYPAKNISPQGPVRFCSGEVLELKAPEGTSYLWSDGATTPSITVTESGSYSVLVGNKFGCTILSEELTIEVDPDETPLIEVEGDTVFCRGAGNTRLHAIGNGNYSWSNGWSGSFIPVNNSGQYTVTSIGLCGEFTSEPVTVYALDPGVENPLGDTLSEPGTAKLQAEGNDLYWYDSENTLRYNGPVFEVYIDETTSFFVEDVKEMAEVRCESPRTEVVAVLDSSTNVFSLNASGIKVYPNPVTDHLFLDFSKAKEAVERLDIFSLNGHLIYHLLHPGELVQLPLNEIASGVYYLRIHTSKAIFLDKLVKVSTE